MSTPTRSKLTDRQKYDRAARRQQAERHATADPIPARITIALDSAGLWGPEVDRRLGGEEPMVDEWEAGLRVPTREQVEALAELTGQPIGFFYRRIEPGEYPTTTRICHRGRGKKSTTVVSSVDERGVMHVEVDPQPKLADVVPLPRRTPSAPAGFTQPSRCRRPSTFTGSQPRCSRAMPASVLEPRFVRAVGRKSFSSASDIPGEAAAATDGLSRSSTAPESLRPAAGALDSSRADSA